MALLPVAIAVAVMFYTEQTAGRVDPFPYPWAPLLVQRPIESVTPATYALVAALSAWSAARVREAGTWELAPYRRPWRIIGQAVGPVVLLGWLMFLGSVAWAFVQHPTLPTPSSLLPLLLVAILTVAWAMFGFTVGHLVKPLIATPVLACGVFILVAFPHGMEPFSLRHLSGEYLVSLGPAESATVESLVAQMLPTLGLVTATGIVVWTAWNFPIRALFALVVLIVPAVAAYGIVKDWGPNPSISLDVQLVCQGEKPQVCLPAPAMGDLPEVHAEVEKAFRIIEKFALTESLPDRVEDQLAYGRFAQENTPQTAYMQLSYTHHSRERGELTRSIVQSSVQFGCDADTQKSRTVQFWLQKKLDGIPAFEHIASEDPYYTRAQYDEAVAEAERTSVKSDAEQRQWLADTKAAACQGRAS
ncbi:hypothetical protein [Streptomyces sp. NPDC005012]|uniref:hypothetical protein n=1 Tax=Streptomyces sp. NPDC005012 TaxID=3154558 RepID=UPI0033A21AC3